MITPLQEAAQIEQELEAVCRKIRYLLKRRDEMNRRLGELEEKQEWDELADFVARRE